jgi:hypothetical protein
MIAGIGILFLVAWTWVAIAFMQDDFSLRVW